MSVESLLLSNIGTAYDASWMCPWGGIPGMYDWEEVQGGPRTCWRKIPARAGEGGSGEGSPNK